MAPSRLLAALYSTASRHRRRLPWAIRRTRRGCVASLAPRITAPCPLRKSRTLSCLLGRISRPSRRGDGTRCTNSIAPFETVTRGLAHRRRARAAGCLGTRRGRQHRIRHQHACEAHSSTLDDAVNPHAAFRVHPATASPPNAPRRCCPSVPAGTQRRGAGDTDGVDLRCTVGSPHPAAWDPLSPRCGVRA